MKTLNEIQKAVVKNILNDYKNHFNSNEKPDAEIRAFFEMETPFDPKTEDDIDLDLRIEEWIRNEIKEVEKGNLTENMVELIAKRGNITCTLQDQLIEAVGLPTKQNPIYWI